MKYLIISCLLVSIQVSIKAQSTVSTVDNNSKNITNTNHTTTAKKQTAVKESVSTVDMSKEKKSTKTSTKTTEVIINETNSSVYIKPE